MRQRVALVYTVFLGTPQNKHMVALKLPQRYVSMWYKKYGLTLRKLIKFYLGIYP